MSRFQDGYKLLNVCQKYIDKHIWCYTYVYIFGFLIDNVFFEVAILNFSFLFEQPQLYVHVNQNCQILVYSKNLWGYTILMWKDCIVVLLASHNLIKTNQTHLVLGLLMSQETCHPQLLALKLNGSLTEGLLAPVLWPSVCFLQPLFVLKPLC